jgi:hypothetical protein
MSTMLLHWIESQPTTTIAFIMLAGCYLLAVVVHLLVRLLGTGVLAGELQATTPVMLTPLAVILGLMIAFLAQRVWTNIDHAHTYIGAETSALRQTVLLTNALPREVGEPLRSLIRDHVNFVIAEDWDSMSSVEGSRDLPELLAKAMLQILAYSPTTHGQQIAQEQIVVALNVATTARLDRILLSESAISPLQWQVIIVISVLILITICMVHLDRPFTTMANLFVFSSAVATCLILITVNDRPFAEGGIQLTPQAFEELARDLQ